MPEESLLSRFSRHPERSGPTLSPPAEGGSGHAVEGSLFAHPASTRLIVFILAVVAAFLSGCAKKQISKSELRAITDDVVSAARRVAGNKAEIEIHPQTESLQTATGTTSHSVDVIFISLSSPAQAAPLDQALSQIARRHKLDMSESSTSGLLRFDFSRNGVHTHSIHAVLPLAARARPPVVGHGPGGARLAIIIDDMGHDRSSADQLFALPFPLTISILPHLPLSSEIAEEAHRRGDQIMLHLPMEPEPGNGGPDGVAQEPIELRVGMSADEVNATLASMLETVPHAAGVNNHEGSRATADAPLMQELMPGLRARNLFFIDSRTTASTVAFNAAESVGVRSASRKVFLDDTQTKEAVIAQLELAARDAARDGSAIAIGHPHPATIAALAQEVPALESRGIRLVFASDLVH
ncbi:MAG TPA: divergent polysaccharide deacetylase family protein [Candidatus Solibacter sp.]|nr:divergent polysaccharide deacetylase family protein [Candidatus Solibacter sp.]